MKPVLPFLVLWLFSCDSGIPKNNKLAEAPPAISIKLPFDSTYKTIHVLVALCDNKYQGIVPVPAKIGNGQDKDNNLYWGCAAGVRTYFKKSNEWVFVKTERISDTILERIVFKHKTTKYFLVADAYNGKFIRQCIYDFFKSCGGQQKDTIVTNKIAIGIKGNAKLIAYIGHDGLMDFNLTDNFNNTDSIKRDAIMLACISKKYFASHLQQTKANPLLWTTGLMCPEAYTLHDALRAYIAGDNAAQVRNIAAKAYSTHQKCSEKAARGLLVGGW